MIENTSQQRSSGYEDIVWYSRIEFKKNDEAYVVCLPEFVPVPWMLRIIAGPAYVPPIWGELQPLLLEGDLEHLKLFDSLIAVGHFGSN